MRWKRYLLGLGFVLAVTFIMLAVGPLGSRWRHVARFILQPCEARLPDLASCPRSKSPTFSIDARLWRVSGDRGEMRFIGALPAGSPPKFLGPLREELVDSTRRDTTRFYYYEGPGTFFLFSSAVDVAIRVSVEQSR
jgi:hypothetical protein